MSYSVEAVTRIGFVTRSNVVEMQPRATKAVLAWGFI